jgi:hypothetical protein
MKITVLNIVIVLILSWGSMAKEPTFHIGVKLEAAGKPIDVQVGHLVPCVSDWNGDGRKDLLVGRFSGGQILLYLNEGTHEKPVFTQEGQPLQAGGHPISLAAG